jgi:DNA replication protein DnaC
LAIQGQARPTLAWRWGWRRVSRDSGCASRRRHHLCVSWWEARDEKRLLRYQKLLARQELLIVDELGFVPLSKTGAEMLFEVFSQRYERSSTLVTSNLPFAEWTEVFGSERLTGALLDRLTHHVHILEMNGNSFRLKNSRKKKDPDPQ